MKTFRCLCERFLERLTVLHQDNFLTIVSCSAMWTVAGSGKQLSHNPLFFDWFLFVTETLHFCNTLRWKSFFYWFDVKLHLCFWQRSCKCHEPVHRSFKVTWPHVELCGNIDFCISKSPKGGTVCMHVNAGACACAWVCVYVVSAWACLLCCDTVMFFKCIQKWRF